MRRKENGKRKEKGGGGNQRLPPPWLPKKRLGDYRGERRERYALLLDIFT
jgi:hypothetical protein